MRPARKLCFTLSLMLVLLLYAVMTSGLGQCALCDCKAFAGSKTTNWWCSCKHHYDQHYNNKKGPPGGLQSLTRWEGVSCFVR